MLQFIAKFIRSKNILKFEPTGALITTFLQTNTNFCFKKQLCTSTNTLTHELIEAPKVKLLNESVSFFYSLYDLLCKIFNGQ